MNIPPLRILPVVTVLAAFWGAAIVHAQSKAPAAEALAAARQPAARVFPLAEPSYSAKRIRDFSPFTTALAGFSPERRARLDALLREATLPAIQRRMAAGELDAEDAVLYYLDRIRRYDIDRFNSVMELNPDALAIARALDAERAFISPELR